MRTGLRILVLTACIAVSTWGAGGVRAQTVTFTNATTAAGFPAGLAGWSHAWADYNKDGFADVMLLPHVQVLSGAIPRLYRNNGDGTFTDVTVAAGIPLVIKDPHGIAWADFDGNGWVDYYLVQGGLKGAPPEYNQLLLNNRNGTFTEVAISAGVAGVGHRNRGAYAVDFDRDGDLDIFATAFFRPADDTGGNLLYRNEGSVVFTDVAVAAGLALELNENRTGAWQDYDGDGWADVLITLPCALFKNNGDGTFTDVTVQAGVTASTDCYNAAWGDYDNDGLPDVYVSMQNSQMGLLYRNNGDGTFTDVTVASGAVNSPTGPGGSNRALGITWGDVDNDGRLDLFIDNANNVIPDRLFRNNGDGTFTDITAQAGLTSASGQGADASFVDYDNDGDLDLFVSNGGGSTAGTHTLFRNNGTTNGWLKINLKGRPGQSNRGAVGTKLWLSAGGILRFLEYTGQHYLSQDYIPVHFGLGQATVVDSLTIRWPSGATKTLQRISPNRTITVQEPFLR